MRLSVWPSVWHGKTAASLDQRQANVRSFSENGFTNENLPVLHIPLCFTG